MDWIGILTEASKQVKQTIMPLVGTALAQETYGRGAGGDPKKHIDLQAERALVKTLLNHEISFTLISEESGIKTYGEHPTCYVTTDPIDGTTNTLRGLPFACSSIAISKIPRLDAIEVAAVADIFHEVVYVAQKNLGTYRNQERVESAQITELANAIIGIDFNTWKVAELTKKLNRILLHTKHIRHLGANALELCYVADGTIDAFIDIRGKLRTTDIAAAALIIEEAGARISTLRNTPLTNILSPTETVAFIATGNPQLHQIMLKCLKQV